MENELQEQITALQENVAELTQSLAWQAQHVAELKALIESAAAGGISPQDAQDIMQSAYQWDLMGAMSKLTRALTPDG